MKKLTKYTLIILACLIFMLALLPNKSVFAAVPASNKIFNIVNKGSGRNLNVNLGTDANGTNVIQWSNDGSTEQMFKLEQVSSGVYRLRAMSSSYATNRVLDVLRVGGVSTGAIASGCNVDIWTTSSATVDTDCQYFTITERTTGYFTINLKSNTNLVLTAVGTANGTGAGNTSTSAGNVIIQTYSSSNNNQLWSFKQVVGSPTHTYQNLGGTKSLTYYIDNSCVSTAFATLFNGAAANWSPTITLSRASTLDGTNFNVYGEPSAFFNDPTALAFTRWCNTKGTYLDPDVNDWNWSEIRLNNDHLLDVNDTIKRGTMTHEIGHVYGLTENSNNPNSIMCQMTPPNGNPGRTVQTPQVLDRVSIIDKY